MKQEGDTSMKKNKFIKSSIVVMILIILGKVLALVRDSLIAAKFGAADVTDIYNFSLGVVYLLTTISYGLTTTFIPLHSEHINKQQKKESNIFVNNVINVAGAATFILTIILIIFAPQVIDVFAHGFTKNLNKYNTSVSILRIMLLSLIFITLQSIITGVLQVHREFFEPAAMAAVSNVVYIIYLVFLTKKYGIKGFAYATVIGFILQLIINLPKYKKLEYRYSTAFNLKDSEMIKMFKLMLPVIISTSLIQLNVFVNRSFATNLYSGAVTVLDFSNKINTLAYEVFAIGIAMIVYPALSEYAVIGDKHKYKGALSKAINTILLILVPAAVAIAVLRVPLITIIFKRGAFTNKAADLTSSALLLYTPAMIAYGIRDILNKAFYSFKDTKTPMINSFIGIGLNIIIDIFIMKKMGVSGLTLATSISAIFTTILMFVALNKKIGNIGLKASFITFIKITLSSFIMGIVIYFINEACLNRLGFNLKGSVVSLLCSFIFGCLIYAISIYIFKVEEFNNLVGEFKKVKPNKGEN